MSEWQPIETAPGSCTEFLAYDVSSGKMAICCMIKWGDGLRVHPMSQDETGASPDEFGYNIKNVRYWMPLPPSPTEKDDA